MEIAYQLDLEEYVIREPMLLVLGLEKGNKWSRKVTHLSRLSTSYVGRTAQPGDIHHVN